MKKILIVLALTLIFSSIARAELPHVFTPGTPAKADEVNANFTELDDRIALLESDNQRVCAKSGSWWQPIHKLTYAPKVATVGQKIIIANASYRITKIPFVEFGTGDKYTVKFPVLQNASGEIAFNVQTSHVRKGTTCGEFSISGFPAFTQNLSESRTMSFFNNGRSESVSRINIFYGLSIKINETVLSLSISAGKEEQRILLPFGDYDFSDNLDTSRMIHSGSVSAVDDLIDYVEIVKTQ